MNPMPTPLSPTRRYGRPSWSKAICSLDVDGNRLQILSGYPLGVSRRDRSDLGAMIGSLEIG